MPRTPDEEVRALLEATQSRLAAVQEISRALSRTLAIDDLLPLIMDHVTELMHADRSTLFLLERANGSLWSKIAQSDGRAPLEIRLEAGEGLAGWVAQTGQTINMKDAYKDSRFNPDVDVETGYRTRSVLCQPMRNSRGWIIGVIQVLNKENGYFTDEDEELLSALGGQAAVSIENSQLYLSVEQKNLQLEHAHSRLRKKITDREVLLAVEQAVSGGFSLRDVFEQVLEQALESIPSGAGSILLRTQGASQLTFCLAERGRVEEFQRIQVEPGIGLVGWCAEHGEPLLCNDAGADGRHAHEIAKDLGIEVETALCAPIIDGDRYVGALQLLNRQGNQGLFTDDDQELLILVAGQLARAINLNREREEVMNENRLAAIGQSLSGLVHDFRTPLTVISAYSQMLETEEDPEERRDFAQTVRSQIEHVNTMVREVLAYARGETQLLIQKQLIPTFFNELMTTLKADLERLQISLNLILDDRGFAYFDAAKIRRALVNLARNAGDAMRSSEKRELTLRVFGDTEQLHIHIEDTGSGIPEEIRETLFDEFVTHGKESGTGLGLAIVKKVVNQHKGEIQVQSTLGQGTTFELCLPRRALEEESTS